MALEAIAAITGQTIDGTAEMFLALRETSGDTTPANSADLAQAVNLLCTRVGLASALVQEEREQRIAELRELEQKAPNVSGADIDLRI